jgi:hypothetical protein
MSKKSTAVATKEETGGAVGFTLDLNKLGSIVENTDGGDGEFTPFISLRGDVGEWREEDFTHEGQQFLVNVMSFKRGMAAWAKKLGNPPADKVWRYLAENPAPIEGADLPAIPRDYAWQEYYEFTIKNVDDDREWVFSAGNTSAVNAVKSIIKEIFNPNSGHDLTKEIPVIEIDIAKFHVASVGKDAYKPTFKVKDWVEAEGVTFETPIGESNI